MEWLSIALSRHIVVRGLKYAAIVGGILIGINHGEALLNGEFDSGRAIQMALTIVVPYLVSTSSSVSAVLEMRSAGNGENLSTLPGNKQTAK